MKKIYLIGALALAAGLTSCDDFLDKKPLDTIIDKPEYWSSTTNCDAQINRLYNYWQGYGNSSDGTYGEFYFNLTNDDQAGWEFNELGTGVWFRGNWAYVNVPTSSACWNNPYSRIRGCNYIINGVTGSTLNETQKSYYIGVARLNRAYHYFQLVKRYGDVPYTDDVIETTDNDIIYGPRVDRDKVMDLVLEDLQYAVANITGGSKTTWNKDMANALLAEVALYEGTYCKYRTQAENGKPADNARAEKYLNIAANAAQAVINTGNYGLEAEYGTIYNSLTTASSKEAIFVKAYSYPSASFGHATIAYTVTSTQAAGITRDAFDSYLFLDGKPLATTTLDKSDKVKAIKEGDEYLLSIGDLLAVRDKRLSVQTDAFAAVGSCAWNGRYEGSEYISSGTGYLVKMFYCPELSSIDNRTIGQNSTACPIYSYANVLLDYAEAKAELGTMTQADMDRTVNALNARGGIPAMTISPEADPANDMGISNLLWEVRRCRRVELMYNGKRYWDLVRWHQLDRLGTTAGNRRVLEGINVSDVPAEAFLGTDGQPTVTVSADGYVQVWPGVQRNWNPKYYFFPVPSGQISLNPQLTQNPGW